MADQTLTFTSSELFIIMEMMREARANPFHPGDYQDEETAELIDRITEALDKSYDLEVNELICKDCAKRFTCSFNACERNSCGLYESDSELIKTAIELLQNYLENKEIEHGPLVHKKKALRNERTSC